MAASGTPQPIWHPITRLSEIAALIDGQLAGAEEHYQTLGEARGRPRALDDATVQRVIRVFTEEVEFLDIYDEQLARWRAGPLTPAQCREMERLDAQVARHREVATAIVVLAEELSAITIDVILGKSDLELGLETLAGLFPPPSTTRAKPPRHSR
jgi:hypothetical protein